jgi:hypothetical protein
MSDSGELDWVALKDVHQQYGFKSMGAARNAVAGKRFPVETYKLGNKIVIDREVHKEFFSSRREAGLRALRNNITDGSPQHGGEDA